MIPSVPSTHNFVFRTCPLAVQNICDLLASLAGSGRFWGNRKAVSALKTSAVLIGIILVSGQWCCLNAAETASQQPRESLVYFVGTVERVVSGRPIVDLGEVHSLRPGETVTVFRIRDNQFRPQGTMKVAEAFSTWMIGERTGSSSADVGDVIVFIRSVAELGTAGAMRDRFLADQYIGNRDRNGYSTFRLESASETLLTLQKSQPRWVQAGRRVAGKVYSHSLGSDPPGSLERLFNQIDLFRQLESEGLEVSRAAGQQWQVVMAQLMTRQPTVPNVLEETTEPAEDSSADTASLIAVQDIQKAVERRLYYRSQEEQSLASALSLGVLRLNPRNEAVWLRQRLSRSQFPLLASDEQFLADVAFVLRQLREQAQ